jgi:hypothetical protein
VQKYLPFFASGPSFLDPQLSKDGTPFGPKRYKEIVKECWYVSDNLNTSYTDVLNLAYQDRVYLIECINEKKAATARALEEAKMHQHANSV